MANAVLDSGTSGSAAEPGAARTLDFGPVVCPADTGEIPVPADTILAAVAQATASLDPEELHKRTIDGLHRLMPYPEKAFGSRMGAEYVAVVRRNASHA